MSIRLKIVLIVLPLIITTLLLTGVSSFFSATNAITGIATEFLGFKAAEFQKYAESQWLLLVENNMTERPSMVAATQAAIESYANSIVRSDTEVIFALDGELNLAMQTGDLALEENERAELQRIVESRTGDLITPRIAGKERVAKGFYLEPFDWYILVSEERDTFYSQVNQITQRTGIILVAAIILGVIMVLVFAGYLTNPLTRIVQAMENIISTNDMTSRVAVEYNDETGKLAHTFNIMVGALERAYKQIKRYALGAAVAQKKEHKIRTMFQKFVPADVIDQFFANPEKMLVGENRVISILFSDIRSFTSISEQMMPDDLVSSLNRYFTVMVDIIAARGGTIDKYIGDAIMAFFGAPARHQDDALNSVLAGIEMTEALGDFNAHQRELGKPEFRIGVGINYGVVTVGNIGTDKKMDYTIIGDMVNLASRMEGLTKKYKQPLLISESLHQKVHEQVRCRLIDTVAVKGRAKGVKIYSAKKTLSEEEDKAWTLHNTAMDHYYKKDFDQAIHYFQDVRKIFSEDYASQLMIDRCRQFQATPPPADWNGVEIMTEK
ncbi:MAG: HAMP domain-containing protein [Spirochaetaceae bacterium]|nr:MAG: HAMP domain-containing protein [Spirochaetaceae bacterium]